MMIVGLTGGIGSGKTTVGRFFAELGVPVYNSDKEARRLMQSSKKLVKEITVLFGEEAFSKGKLNNKYIAELVFNDKSLLKRLNALVHPVVKTDFISWANKQDAPYVIQEAAILFENNSYKEYDRMILVKAPITIRLARIIERDATSEEQVLARMNNQWQDEKKSSLSHFVIENVALTKTKSEVKRIHQLLLQSTDSESF